MRAIGGVVAAVTLVLAVACAPSAGDPPSPDGATERASPTAAGILPVDEMPPFSPALAAMSDFYRIAFLPDGYPGRDDGDDGIREHPLYGVYVINDYLRQHRDEPSEELAAAIRTVAHAAVGRMDGHEGALVFWYAPEMTDRADERHYSGLTQAYYAVSLHRAGTVLDDPQLHDAAERAFAALLVPAERGGVLYDTPFGPHVAEVPQRPNSWILNGWQSALAYTHTYAELSDSEAAAQLVRDSTAAMAEVLPLYDVPELANSRYGLTGYTYLRVGFDRPGVTLGDVALEIPGEGRVAVGREPGTRWRSWLVADDLDGDRATAPTVRLNVVVSLASHPEPNRLHLDVDAPDGSRVSLEAHLGHYDPLAGAPVRTGWEPVAEARVDGGAVVLDVPPEVIERVVYPTNFLKEIGGEQVNVYHRLHAHRLHRLAEATGVAELVDWAERWEGYICRWAEMDLYDGLMVTDPDAGAGATVDPAAYCHR